LKGSRSVEPAGLPFSRPRISRYSRWERAALTEGTDRGAEDFLVEAQELVEMFSRNLLAIDAAFKRGRLDPDSLNEAFRSIHTLKGLSGLFSMAELGQLTHRLEDLLGEVRLGRTLLSPELLDVLFAAVDLMHGLLAMSRSGDASAENQTALVALVAAVDGMLGQGARSESVDYGVDPAIWSVLTEYEEHRLRSNLSAGMRLYRIRVAFLLATIDTEIEGLKDRARQLGEVITYLPTGEMSSPEVLELDLILASGEVESTVTAALGGSGAQVYEVPISRLDPGVVARPPVLLSLQLGAVAPSSGQAPSEVRGTEEPRAERSVLAGASAREPVAVKTDVRASSGAVRVDIRKLDGLMNSVGELGILRSALGAFSERIRALADRTLHRDLRRLERSLERRLADMQEGILEMRMVPLSQVFDRLARGVRQTSRELSKDVKFVVTGADTEIDKLIVEELGDPLLHMLRNAIDHGIESADERIRTSKPVSGTIALNAYQKGNHVLIEVEDDGRGIDESRLVRKAIELGHLAEQEVQQLSRPETLALMFLPGLSTKQGVSEVSGRGVGMDVVKTNVSRIGGVIDVQSELGRGTKLTLTLPVTLAIFRALLVQSAGQAFAIPLSSIAEVLSQSGPVRVIDGREMMTLRGATLPLVRLASLLQLGQVERGRQFVVVVQVGERRLGFVVDEISGQQDIVIKALGASLQRIRGFAGATELSDQRVCLVLDVAALIEEVMMPQENRYRLAVHG
jgi:two-component system, chemotaxis family, sensor kinase CheA